MEESVKVILLVGEPGAGKSSLTKLLFPNRAETVKYRLLRGSYHDGVFVCGIYDPESTYPGTDALSMAVQPDLIEFIERCQVSGSPKTLFAEGDRISNCSLLEILNEMGIEPVVFCLEVLNDTLQSRRSDRGDTFKESWLEGRKTKIKGFCEKAKTSGKLVFLRNDSPKDLINAASRISEELR